MCYTGKFYISSPCCRVSALNYSRPSRWWPCKVQVSSSQRLYTLSLKHLKTAKVSFWEGKYFCTYANSLALEILKLDLHKILMEMDGTLHHLGELESFSWNHIGKSRKVEFKEKRSDIFKLSNRWDGH